jgi:ABC-type polysaccharide/polyol phosphate transport system ATPase subunit
MPVTQGQIDSAADALAVQKLQAGMQLEAGTTQKAVAADVARQAASAERAAAAAESIAQFAQEVPTKDQELWVRLYEMHLKARLGPAIITSTTADSVMNDMVRDAVTMTTVAFPLVKGEVDKLAPTAGN